MKTVDLHPNHRRSFSSTLFLLEKMVSEVREVLSAESDLRMQKVTKDLSESKKKEVFAALNLLENEIGRLA
ncbi:MAG TPA: hypothetical protein ENJ69_00400, partial [Bacteroidetes bacterium]|nr:hypothetical protein [Bacteroidota bacterium]